MPTLKFFVFIVRQMMEMKFLLIFFLFFSLQINNLNWMNKLKAKTKTMEATALHMAAAGGHSKIVKILLENGANAENENAVSHIFRKKFILNFFSTNNF